MCVYVCIWMQFEPSIKWIAWFQNQSFLKWKQCCSRDHPGLISLCENVIVYMHACFCVRAQILLQVNEDNRAHATVCFSCECVCVSLCVGITEFPIFLFIGGSEKWWTVWREKGPWWHSLMFNPLDVGHSILDLFIMRLHLNSACFL